MKTSSFVSHFAAAIIVSGVIFLIYVAVQQHYRSAANDPQLQLAGEISYRLAEHQPVESLLPHDTIDLSKSLGLFVALYDERGRPVSSNGFLNGEMPDIPRGVFDVARQRQENAVTWMPSGSVREAIVVKAVPASSIAYVVAGRSLREVEIREANLGTMALLTWVACMAVILLHFIVQRYLFSRQGH